MLAQLHISNLAVIDELELDFSAGMTTLTGETGAGKSILVDALALALGQRADSKAIRTGTERCTIIAHFDISSHAGAARWLEENDLDTDGECIIRRVLSVDGRSRGYINGSGVPMQTLRELGEQLVDICGQQDHHSLRHTGIQQQLVDDYGSHAKLRAKMADAYAHWQSLQEEFARLSTAREDRAARQELLDYQVSELNELSLAEDEIEELEREHMRASNADRIASVASTAIQRLYEADEGAVHSIMAAVRSDLAEAAALDPALQPAADMLGEAEILVGETVETLRQASDRIEHDPAALASMERRLGKIHELARKHRVEATELRALAAGLAGELDSLQHSDERLDELGGELADAEQTMQKAAQTLTRARKKSAADISVQVTNHMQELGMAGGSFTVSIEAQPDDRVTRTGVDRIEFLVATNPGQAAGPLSRIASGGELSRISLALQVVAMQKTGIPTLIFDEVDAGVGGSVAEIVGGRLQQLSASRQVLCVTHLPQVASQAGHHLRVTKITDGQATRTAVNALTADERIEEVARMLGGVKITQKTRAHAEEMLG